MDATRDLTTAIADVAMALADQRLKSQMAIRTLDKALQLEGQTALALIQSIPAGSGLSHSPAGHRIDVVA